MVEPSIRPVKFLCSYGGKILPCVPSGKLRYVGGEIRVLCVDRSIEFVNLLVKLGEFFGSSVSLRCQVPNEDLDALVTITSDEELALIIEEYDRASKTTLTRFKIRAFLSSAKSMKKNYAPRSSLTSSENKILYRNEKSSKLENIRIGQAS